MSARLHLATPQDLDRLASLVAAFHAHLGSNVTESAQVAAMAPLLEGSPHGAIWLIGPKSAPVGYLALSFGWSISLGGLVGVIDQVFIREGVRGRGMATEALRSLLPELAERGLGALQIKIAADNARLTRFAERVGFGPSDSGHVLTWHPPAG